LPAILLAGWQVAVAAGLLDKRIVPEPTTVAKALWQWIFGSSGALYQGDWLLSVGATASRVGIGFAVAAVGGIVLGILIGYFVSVRTIVDPIVQLLRPVPTLAWLPLSVVFFGFTPAAGIFLISYASFFPVVLNTIDGVVRSQRQFTLVGGMLGANRRQMLWHIVFPAALPSIFTGLRIALGLSWVMSIAAEMVAVQSGLGYALMNSYTVYRYDILIAAMISFAVLGFVSDRLVILIQSRVLKGRS
jgi:ABC-type nitrate/sulfonate/bicarbonate transport system permease component